MSSSNFRILSHTVPCSYIREYPHATSHSQETRLHLAVKQYTPLSNPDPQPGDITLIAAHANAFPKELYEPLWDDLLTLSSLSSSTSKFRIRSIWISDVSHQGASYILNEPHLGNDPGWFDHSRDLLHFINLYSAQLPRPIFGVGHSMGGSQLMNISLFHPRLFQGLILIDPVIQARTAEIVEGAERKSLAAMSTFRRDRWSSREEAREMMGKSEFYKKWDRRVWERWVEWGVREGGTVLYPEDKKEEEQGGSKKVTLTTPKGQEVYTYLRPNYQGYGFKSGGKVDRRTHPDVDPENPNSWPFYRIEPTRMFGRLEELRPSVLYVIGGESLVNSRELDEVRVARTGKGIGGSGGVEEGRVKSVTIQKAGHLVPMEASQETAREMSVWLDEEVERWKREEEEMERTWYSRPLLEKQAISEEWKKNIGGPLKRVKNASKI